MCPAGQGRSKKWIDAGIAVLSAALFDKSALTPVRLSCGSLRPEDGHLDLSGNIRLQ